MNTDRKTQDDLYIGILVAVLHPRTGSITWGFKEYDPNDKTDFPLPVQFKDAGKIVEPKNPGRVFEVENGDALVVFVDHGYTHPMVRGYVNLDYEAGKVVDPENPNNKIQMIGESRVSGIPTNMAADIWCEAFYEGRPAVLFRQKAKAMAVA